MMNKDDFKRLVNDVLVGIGLHSDNAVQLLLGTCAQESAFGKYRRQIGGGPAQGIFQMEPATFRDIVENYLNFKPELKRKIMRESDVTDLDNPEEIVFNDRLAICMARVHYLRVSEAIPSDLEGWAYYWKKYYNTHLGRGTEYEFVCNYKRYCV